MTPPAHGMGGRSEERATDSRVAHTVVAVRDAEARKARACNLVAQARALHNSDYRAAFALLQKAAELWPAP
ncbi:MAG TPA: hypothetical protein VLL25_20230 [Acidimicrobiales bacterium]|nr:hypothetical protein [Acidimicrobiales bacterium]